MRIFCHCELTKSVSKPRRLALLPFKLIQLKKALTVEQFKMNEFARSKQNQ